MKIYKQLIIVLCVSGTVFIGASQKDGLRLRKQISNDNKAEPKKDDSKRKKTPEEIDQIKKEICIYKAALCCLKATRCCIKPACKYLCKKNK